MPSKMKNSGIEWIGEIPIEWKTVKMKYILTNNDGGVWGKEPNSKNNKLVIRSTEQTIDGHWRLDNPALRDLSELAINNLRIKPNDLLITKSSGSKDHIGKTTIAGTYFDTHECYYSNFLQRLRISHENPKYIWYLFNSKIVRQQFVYMQNSTSGIGNINAENISNVIIPLPEKKIQNIITNFLDIQCSIIDSTIEKTEETIELYKKYKQAVITEAVTKGLNPDVEMKDSGIEWASKIPKKWNTIKLKYLCDYDYQTLDENTNDDFIFDYVDIGAVTYENGIEKYQRMSFKLAPSRARRVVHCGDVIVSTVRTYLKAVAYISNHDFPVIVSTGFLTLKANSKILKSSFLKYAVLSETFISNIEAESTGTSYPAITATKAVNLKIIVPPLLEQQQIADYLDETTSTVNNIISEKEQLIERLKNYKQSIIYEYVTGKKEVE